VVGDEPVTDPIRRLAAKLTGRWDAIVGIPRGGLVVAAGLGYALDVSRVASWTVEYSRTGPVPDIGAILAAPRAAIRGAESRILLVEDGTDTGTLLEAAAWWHQHYLSVRVFTAALWVKRSSKYRPDVWLDVVDELPSGKELIRG
jgi:hypoxanthine phosphoribosyltransferase